MRQVNQPAKQGNDRKGDGYQTKKPIFAFISIGNGHQKTMPLKNLYHRIAAMTDPAIATALAAALPTAQGQAQRLLVVQLLARQTSAGDAALIEHYQLLTEDLRQDVARHVVAVTGALRLALSRHDPHFQGRANALAIIREHGTPDLAYLPAEVLRDGGIEDHSPAAAALLTLTQQACASLSPPLTPSPPHPVTPSLFPALQDALTSFPRHRQRAVLLALMHTAPRPMTDLADLADPRSPLVTAIRFLLSGAGHAVTRSALPAALLVPTLRQAALAGLARHAATPDFADVYTHGHLFSHPAIKPALASATQPRKLLPDAAQVAALPPQTQRFTPAWIASLPLPPADRARALGQLGPHAANSQTATAHHAADPIESRPGLILKLTPGYPPDSTHGDDETHTAPDSQTGQQTSPFKTFREQDARLKASPFTRFSALRQLILLDNAPDAQVSPRTIIATFLDDPHPAIATVALRHLLKVAWDGLPRTLARLVNSPHLAVRRLASQRLAPLAFARLWDAWPRMDHDRQLVAGRAMLKIDPDFIAHLADKLALPRRPERLRAITIIHTLNQAPLFESALLALATGPDEVVAATAISALGGLTTDAALSSIEAALTHTDARVRANAVEALAQAQSARHITQLMSMARSDVGRPRANAIKALLAMRAGEALSALTTMLDDHQPDQRISALWLVETLGLLDVARQVAEMSLTDPEPRVKARADRVITRLLAA